VLEETDRVVTGPRRQMHVPHRRREVRVTGQLLDRLRRGTPHREVRAERVAFMPSSA